MLKEISAKLNDRIGIYCANNDQVWVVWVFGRMCAEVSAEPDTMRHILERTGDYAFFSQPVDLLYKFLIWRRIQLYAACLHSASAHFNCRVICINPTTAEGLLEIRSYVNWNLFRDIVIRLSKRVMCRSEERRVGRPRGVR